MAQAPPSAAETAPHATTDSGVAAPPKRKRHSDPNRKPLSLKVQPDKIPADLKALDRWVVWRWEWNSVRMQWDKPPRQTTGKLASTTDAATWATFEQALAAHTEGKADGVGVVLAEGLVGVDVDSCRDLSGKLSAQASEIGRTLNTYSEWSPSAEGIRLFAYGSLPPTGRKKGDVEMYQDAGRYLTVTGHRISEAGAIEYRPAELLKVHAAIFGSLTVNGTQPARPVEPETIADAEILERARQYRADGKFAALYNEGDWEKVLNGKGEQYASQSDADYGLIGIFKLFTHDAEQIERLMYGSALSRDKWTSARGSVTLLRYTIDKALQEVGEILEPIESLISNAAPRFHVVEDEAGEPQKALTAWPEQPPESVYVGLAGRIVEAVGEGKGLDRAAILFQFLVYAGVIVGQQQPNRIGPHMYQGDRVHRTNLYLVNVADTGDGKGDSITSARLIPLAADPFLRVVYGFTSGEAMVEALHDEKYELDLKTGKSTTLTVGVLDRRLIIEEEEFSALLAVNSREGVTLSQNMRRAFDGGTLEARSRGNPIKSTSHVVGMIGDITTFELRKSVKANDLMNGFANRNLWITSRRTARPLRMPQTAGIVVKELAAELKSIVRMAAKLGEMRYSADAEEILEARLPGIESARRGSMLSKITQRVRVQIMRLAMIYAVLDQTCLITGDHMTAAIELVAYTKRCASQIFGRYTGDSDLDRILIALETAGGVLSYSEIYNDTFHGHISTHEIRTRLLALREWGLVEKRLFSTSGRDREVWSLS